MVLVMPLLLLLSQSFTAGTRRMQDGSALRSVIHFE